MVMHSGLSRRLDIRISEVVEEEIAGASDANTRALGLARLKMFPALRLSSAREADVEQLAGQLATRLFPDAEVGSRTWDHNLRDCRHLAIHKLMGRAVFLTLDDQLYRKRKFAEVVFGIHIATPRGLVEELGLTQPTSVAMVEPTVAARKYRPQDEAEVRRVLAPLAADYPDFDGWLTETLEDSDSTIVVGLLDEHVAGAVIWKSRGADRRAVKLAAFRIDESARNSGLGGHMLFHSLRQWIRAGYEIAYVTVPSAHADLVTFFASIGFLVQGVAPMRYQHDAAEIVMGKLILKMRVTPDDLESLAHLLCTTVFGRPGDRVGGLADDRLWFLPPQTIFPNPAVDLRRGAIQLVDETSGSVMRHLTAFELETAFYPLRLAVPGRRALLVPIRPDWADRMLTYAGKQEPMFRPPSDPLLIRSDNVYYCFPRCREEVDQNCRILFYVSAPVSALVGEAIITQSMVDYPEVLHQLFGDLGIYTLEQIRRHVEPRGTRAGMALALRFSFYVPLPHSVNLAQLRKIMKAPRFSPQGLHPVEIETYEALRSTGGLEW